MIKTNGAVFNYSQYINWMIGLVADGKTSGEKQTEALVSFTSLNLIRMERLNKTLAIDNTILDALSTIKEKQIWYLIAEVWCGDCAQNLPVIGKIAEVSRGLIDLRIIQRDENPEWMEKYHTDGSKSIPKLIAFDAYGKELYLWGARPQAAQQILNEWKQNPNGRSWDNFELELHTWYARDKSKTIQKELYEKMSSNNEISNINTADFIRSN